MSPTTRAVLLLIAVTALARLALAGLLDSPWGSPTRRTAVRGPAPPSPWRPNRLQCSAARWSCNPRATPRGLCDEADRLQGVDVRLLRDAHRLGERHPGRPGTARREVAQPDVARSDPRELRARGVSSGGGDARDVVFAAPGSGVQAPGQVVGPRTERRRSEHVRRVGPGLAGISRFGRGAAVSSQSLQARDP